ncbi:MAG: protein kinase [Ignavibacteriales bacterium]|nr:protein kinase [Ignavibacteriales bacterium]MCF8314767.1 protein kinase [Ignavibacteriales bacterium]MCF8437985.1 protein kinase [Ignavibacteriales bacterium]
MENLSGLVIDNYKIISTLGQGGMGIVYKAYDMKLERFVAIKMMSSKMFDNERFIERFKREAKNQAKLLHTNIVTVYGFIEYSDLLGIAMEYVEGESLEKVLYRQKRINIYDAIYIMKQILAGMEYAHIKGFVHRDIKPSNIIFNQEGIAKIMDFGISKSFGEKRFTKTGSKLGTVYYMSPEQVRGEEVTYHTDIYAIGATFYEMITGEPPFNFKSEYDIMDAHINRMPDKISQKLPGTPEMIDILIARSMSKNPYERFNSCQEFSRRLEDIEKYLLEMKEKAKKDKEKKPTKVRAFSIMAAATIIIAVLGFAYFLFNQSFELVSTGKIQEFDDKYNIQSLFTDPEEKMNKVVKQNSGINTTINSVFFVNQSAGVAFAEKGVILTTNDQGKEWTPKQLNTYANLYDGYFFRNGRSFIVGDSSVFFQSQNFFQEWERVELAYNVTLTRVNFVNDKLGFVLGSQGFLMRTINGGYTWDRIGLPTTALLYDIDFGDENTGVIVGWGGVAFYTDDQGATWDLIPRFTDNYLKSIDFLDDDIALAVGGGGSLFRSENGGRGWIKLAPPDMGGFQKVKFISDQTALVAGTRGLLLFSQDKGRVWKPLNTGLYTQFNNIAVNNTGQIFVVGVNGTIIKLF